MSATVAEMNVDDLRELIGELLDEKLEEILGDPDSDLEIRPELRARLVQQMERVRAGDLGVTLAEITD